MVFFMYHRQKMTEIDITYSQTIVVNAEVPWQRVLAGICVEAQIVSIAELMNDDPLVGRSPTPTLVILDTFNDIDRARLVRKKQFQRVYLCGGYNAELTAPEADRAPVELETGIYRWYMPAMPCTINGWAGAIILHIVAKYLYAEHPHCHYTHRFCADFVREMNDLGDPEALVPSMFFNDLVGYEDRIINTAKVGEGRRLERERAAATILDVAQALNPDQKITLPSTFYNEEIMTLAEKKKIEVVISGP